MRFYIKKFYIIKHSCSCVSTGTLNVLHTVHTIDGEGRRPLSKCGVCGKVYTGSIYKYIQDDSNHLTFRSSSF